MLFNCYRHSTYFVEVVLCVAVCTLPLSVAVVSDAGSSIAIEANELLATAAHWSHWNMMFCKVPGKKKEGLSISAKTMDAQTEQRLGIVAGSSQVKSGRRSKVQPHQ